MRTFHLLIPVVGSLIGAASVPLDAQAPAAPRTAGGDLCTGGKASGTGLRGAYYSADPHSSRPSLVRVDPRIDAATVSRLPGPFAAAPPRAVRWCGWIRPIVSGKYRIQSGIPTMRVEIDKRPVTGPGALAGKSVELEAGKSYAIWIELADPAHAGEFSLQWTPPFGATYDVPPTVLFPPIETVQPGC